MDLRDGRELEPEPGIARDQHCDGMAERGREDGTLHVAAGECRDRRVRRPGLDFVARDLPCCILPERRAVQPPAAAGEWRSVELAKGDVVGDAHAADTGV